jgi:hypothetical protein
MTYLIIAGWDANNHPVRTNIMETLEEADALVNKLINDMPEGLEAPDTFHVPDPEVDPSHIVVDPITKTITVDVAASEAEANARAVEEVQKNRRDAYHAESDELFFQEQRGEISEGTWTAKVDEIKLRFPK